MKTIVLVFMSIILLISCKKYVAEPEEIKGVSKSTHGRYEQPCRVDYSINPRGDTAFYTYNQWGDPSKIEASVTPTGEPNAYFTYDNNKRLVELKRIYANQSINDITRYYYKGNKVIKDSVFVNPSLSDLYHVEVVEGKYLYDNYDRIIEYNFIDSVTEGGYGFVALKDTFRYSYPDENPYIENRNALAGNRVLMFVNRYYNKTTAADSYNTFGYPTNIGQYEIVYNCVGSKKIQQPTE